MWTAIISAIAALFKILIPVALEKANEPTKAIDAPTVPKRYRDAWADRVRRFTSRIRPPK
jgi:hypothetical protein